MIDWQGNGEAAEWKNSGSLKLKLEKGRYANLHARSRRTSTPITRRTGLNLCTIFLGSDKMSFQASLTAKGETLQEVSKIQVDQGQAKYATGYVSLPFVQRKYRNGETLVSK